MGSKLSLRSKLDKIDMVCQHYQIHLSDMDKMVLFGDLFDRDLKVITHSKNITISYIKNLIDNPEFGQILNETDWDNLLSGRKKIISIPIEIENNEDNAELVFIIIHIHNTMVQKQITMINNIRILQKWSIDKKSETTVNCEIEAHTDHINGYVYEKSKHFILARERTLQENFKFYMNMLFSTEIEAPENLMELRRICKTPGESMYLRGREAELLYMDYPEDLREYDYRRLHKNISDIIDNIAWKSMLPIKFNKKENLSMVIGIGDRRITIDGFDKRIIALHIVIVYNNVIMMTLD